MLRSRDLSYFLRLQKAATNAPPMRLMEQGEPVQALQRALADLGYSLPQSFARGAADGVLGKETIRAIREFQAREALMCDGIAGATTLHLIDEYLCGQYFYRSSINNLLTPTSHVICPHGARVRMPIPLFGPFLTPEDTYLIFGCPFGKPCRSVKWTVTNKQVRFNGHDTLDHGSIGICRDIHGQTNGPATIIA
ncbi:MAG: peptidoglycan-binding domain-containing protein [Bryobacteraceae bacterium]